MSEFITQACSAGDRLAVACELCGLSERTLQRWRSRATGAVLGCDQRPHAHRPSPSHALSAAERSNSTSRQSSSAHSIDGGHAALVSWVTFKS